MKAYSVTMRSTELTQKAYRLGASALGSYAKRFAVSIQL